MLCAYADLVWLPSTLPGFQALMLETLRAAQRIEQLVLFRKAQRACRHVAAASVADASLSQACHSYCSRAELQKIRDGKEAREKADVEARLVGIEQSKAEVQRLRAMEEARAAEAEMEKKRKRQQDQRAVQISREAQIKLAHIAAESAAAATEREHAELIRIARIRERERSLVTSFAETLVLRQVKKATQNIVPRKPRRSNFYSFANNSH